MLSLPSVPLTMRESDAPSCPPKSMLSWVTLVPRRSLTVNVSAPPPAADANLLDVVGVSAGEVSSDQ